MPKERTAIAWKFFEQAQGATFALCKLCRKKISTTGGGTSNMNNHLKGQHAEEFQRAKNDANAANRQDRQGGDGGSGGEGAINADHYQIVKFIAKDMQPFSVVEDEGFQELIKYVTPSFVMPSRKYVSKVITKTLRVN